LELKKSATNGSEKMVQKKRFYKKVFDIISFMVFLLYF